MSNDLPVKISNLTGFSHVGDMKDEICK